MHRRESLPLAIADFGQRRCRIVDAGSVQVVATTEAGRARLQHSLPHPVPVADSSGPSPCPGSHSVDPESRHLEAYYSDAYTDRVIPPSTRRF